MRRPAVRAFTDLLVWRKGHEFVLAIYQFTADFPKPETYGLAARRCLHPRQHRGGISSARASR